MRTTFELPDCRKSSFIVTFCLKANSLIPLVDLSNEKFDNASSGNPKVAFINGLRLNYELALVIQ